MRLRLLAAAAGLASGMAVVAFAQETGLPDPELRQQILAFVQRFDPAFNNNDPTALASFYTDDAVLVVPEGLMYGREAIARYWRDLFGKVRFSDHLSTLDKYSPHMIGTSGSECGRSENGVRRFRARILVSVATGRELLFVRAMPGSSGCMPSPHRRRLSPLRRNR